MALPATDNFNRANGGTGANWTTQINAGAIVSNAWQGPGGAFGYEYWNADSFPDDQYGQGVLGLAGVASSQQYAGITLRAAGTGASFDNYFIYADNNNIYIGKNVAGSFTLLQTISGESTNGDTYKATVESSTIKAYRSGVQIGSDQTDAAFTSGSVGVGGLSGFLDDWEGGAIGTAPKRFLATRF